MLPVGSYNNATRTRRGQASAAASCKLTGVLVQLTQAVSDMDIFQL